MCKRSNFSGALARSAHPPCNQSNPNQSASPATQLSNIRAANAGSDKKFFFEFGIFGANHFSRSLRRAACAALAEMDRALSEYDKRINDILRDPRLSKGSRRFLRDLWFGDRFDVSLSWGNRHVRRAACCAAIFVCLEHARSHAEARRGKIRLRMVTTSAELGVTSFTDPHLSLASICGHFDRAMRNARMEGLGFLDIALFHDAYDQRPNLVAFHMHAFARAFETAFRAKRAERRANPRNLQRNSLGGKLVRITAKSSDPGGALSPTEVAKLGYYTSKISCALNMRFESDSSRGNYKSLQGWDTITALRHLELYSRFDAMQVVRGVGALGRKLRQQWKDCFRRVLGVEALPWGHKLEHGALNESWATLYRELDLPFSLFEPDA